MRCEFKEGGLCLEDDFLNRLIYFSLNRQCLCRLEDLNDWYLLFLHTKDSIDAVA